MLSGQHGAGSEGSGAAQRRKRGRRGGARQSLKCISCTSSLPLPSILLANVRSLHNKLDELHANISCQWAYKDAGFICITDTWLDGTIVDSQLSLSGFGMPVRLDRDTVSSQKKYGGGVCVYVKHAWSRITTVVDSSCTSDVDLLALTFRPKYLPREFGQLTLVLMYIPPSGNVRRAAEAIASCVHRLEAASPDSPVFVLWDFNGCRMNKFLPTYHQFVTCATGSIKQLTFAMAMLKMHTEHIRKLHSALQTTMLST